MANSFIKPENGKPDPNVQTVNGKLAFSIPLCQLKTAAGASYSLKIDYRSNFLKEEYSIWSEESTTGLIAAGWSINIGDRIYTASLSPKKYGLLFNGITYLLDDLGTKDGITKYKTHAHSDLYIQYNITENVWHLFTADGIEYIFGKNDSYNTETGTYSSRTGTYTEASSGYTQVRKLISNPNEEGIPSKASADNTICRSTESTLFGQGDWIGPSYKLDSMTEKTNSWLLSHIQDKFDNVIAFSYIQHISNLCNNDNSKTYSVASYLYQIASYTKNALFDKLVFNYSLKDSGEYNVDYSMLERPNGMQQKFEKLFIKKIDHSISGKELEQFLFVYEITDPLTDNSTLIKRQLVEMRFLAGDSSDVQHFPSYKMEYYGSQDSVSVGKAGFDDSHPYHNSKNGALYGNLKAITYPNGEKRTYQYAQNSICSVDAKYMETLSTNDDPVVIHTPYDYSIVLIKSADKKTMQFFVFTWTVTGWKKYLLGTIKYEEKYDTDRLLSYSEHIIGFIGTAADETASNTRIYTIFTRNADAQEIWTYRPVFESPKIYGNEKQITIAVSDYGFAVTGFASPTDTYGNVYAAFTPDLGETFNKVNNYYLIDMTPQSDYYIALSMMEDRYVMFVLFNYLVEDPNPRIRNHYEYYTRVGGMRSNNTSLPVSDLGTNNTQFALVPSWSGESPQGYIGKNIVKLKGVERIGNLFAIHFTTGFQPIYFDDKVGDDPMNWAAIILNTNGFEQFAFAQLSGLNILPAGSRILKDTSDEAPMTSLEPNAAASGDSDIFTCTTSAVVSGNGAIFTWSFYRSDGWDLHDTFFCTYTGGDQTDFKVQKLTDVYNLCIMKDDTFAVFETRTGDNVYQKAYYYYNPSTSLWVKINTGAIDQPSETYNEGSKTALTILEILGFILFLVTLPFGMGEVVGVILTIISVALTVGTFVAGSLIQNTVKSSLNPTCSYYGNRFINDGQTIWFRENSQDRLTAIGAGEAYQPYDSLSGSDIKGNIKGSSQKYGLVYNYIPFATDQNIMYYRNLRNNAVGEAHSITLFSSGFNDAYYDDVNSQFHFYIGSSHWKASQNLETGTLETKHPYFDCVEACAMLYYSAIIQTKGAGEYGLMASGLEKEHLLTFSGSKFCFQSLGGTLPPAEMKDVIQGCTMTHVDCAVEKKSSRYDKDVTQFYLFCGNHYELVDYDPLDGFHVTESGSLNNLYTELTFDRLDSAFTYMDEIYFVQGDNFIAYNLSDGKKTAYGKLGVDFMAVNISDAMNTINFAPHSLSFYLREYKILYLQKYFNGSFHCPSEDYVVDSVDFYTDPRMGDTPSSSTYYQYHTDRCSYSQATGSAIYPQVDICSVKNTSNQLIEVNGDLYYKDYKGNKLSGWKKINNKMYYFDASRDCKAVKGWAELSGRPDTTGTFHYYFDQTTCQQLVASGHQMINSRGFYLNSTGGAMVGVYNTSTGFQYFAPANTSGSNLYGQAIAYSGWLTLGSDKYYFESNSKAVQGWKTIDSKMYYFDNTQSCKAIKGWAELSGRPSTTGTFRYYFDQTTCQQLTASGHQIINSRGFYLNSTGGAMVGVYNTSTGFQYFAPANTSGSNLYGQAITYSGWLTLDSDKYYFESNSKAVQGWRAIDSKMYYFDNTQNCKAIKGWAELSGRPSTTGTFHYYFDQTTCQQLVTSGHQIINSRGFYLNSTGGAMVGVYNTSTGFQYFAPANTSGSNLYGQAITYSGWLTIGSDKYYFGSDAKAVQGWKEIDSKMYYLDSTQNCKAVKGWAELSNRPGTTGTFHYYFDQTTCQQFIASGHQIISSLGFYLNSTGGAMVGVYNTSTGFQYFAPANTSGSNLYGQAITYSGWVTVGSDKYYFESNSKAVSGWKTISGKSYYFDPSTCRMAKGTINIEKQTYYLHAVDGYYIMGSRTDYYEITPVSAPSSRIDHDVAKHTAVLWQANGQNNQRFMVTQQGGGKFYFVSMDGFKTMNGKASGNVFTDVAEHNWIITQDSKDSTMFYFQVESTNNYMEVQNSATANGTPIVIQPKSDKNSQKFYITVVG